MKTCSLALLLCAALSASAQDFTIDWFTVDGGGGTSTGGVYSVSGTIGQPDAGKMSGATYTLVGGFWGIIGAVQTHSAPSLTITRSGANVIISWPAPAEGFVLETRDGLSAGLSWGTVTNSPAVTNDQKTVTIGLTSGSKFYHLRRP